jgi:DNA-binding transcriptional ArsR family regulator
MFRDLDPVLHSQVRLAIISVLMGVKSAEFSFLLECTKTTKGNLSFQLNKLKEAEYIEIIKSFRANYPLTTCKITDKGSDAFEAYVVSISDYLKAPVGKKDNSGIKNKE